MRIKTMVIIIITVLLTVILMQNTEPVKFTLLFGSMYLSKLVALGGIAIIAFILGVLVGRPKRVRQISGEVSADNHTDEKTNTLSDEDREYIN
jgi:uncharacterized integral membrane protein